MKIKRCYNVYCKRLPFAVRITLNKEARDYIKKNVKELNEHEILEKVVKWYLNDELKVIVLIDHEPMIQLKDFALHENVFAK